MQTASFFSLIPRQNGFSSRYGHNAFYSMFKFHNTEGGGGSHSPPRSGTLSCSISLSFCTSYKENLHNLMPQHKSSSLKSTRLLDPSLLLLPLLEHHPGLGYALLL